MSPRAQSMLAAVFIAAVLFFGVKSLHSWLNPPSQSAPATASCLPPAPQPPPPLPPPPSERPAKTAWWDERARESDRCDAAHGTPVLGFNFRLICLKPGSVVFVGEPAPE